MHLVKSFAVCPKAGRRYQELCNWQLKLAKMATKADLSPMEYNECKLHWKRRWQGCLGQLSFECYLSISARLEGAGAIGGASSSSGLLWALPLPLFAASFASWLAISSSRETTTAEAAEVEASTDLMSTPLV